MSLCYSYGFYIGFIRVFPKTKKRGPKPAYVNAIYIRQSRRTIPAPIGDSIYL